MCIRDRRDAGENAGIRPQDALYAQTYANVIRSADFCHRLPEFVEISAFESKGSFQRLPNKIRAG